jgi:uncharacterized protein YdeI (YjbR/CyaY-like superfamily)
MTRNPKVDQFFRDAESWGEEFQELRMICLDCGLSEQFRWGKPCYTFQNKNIVLIHGFKEYCALLFFKGALLRDSWHILIQQTRNVQAARQVRFTHLREILVLANTLKDYIQQAIAVEKAGLKVKLKQTSDFPMPEEFKKRLNEMPALKKAFETLTPGRQRGYLLYFSGAKQSTTRAARVEKYLPQILNGKGLND